jgi:hypothetical protein
MTDTQRCTKCAEVKPATPVFFYRRKAARSGFNSHCVECERTKSRAYVAANRERHRAYSRTYSRKRRADPAGKAAINANILRSRSKDLVRDYAVRLSCGIRARARRKAAPLSPELHDALFLEAWLRRQPRCECCRVEFDFSIGKGHRWAAPSIDAFRPAEGYTAGNARLVCFRCNYLKSDATEAELRRVAEWMAEVEAGQWKEAP